MHRCHICGKEYARPEHLRRHINSAHSPGATEEGPRKKYKCGCGHAFTRSDALLRHKRGHEKAAYSEASRSESTIGNADTPSRFVDATIVSADISMSASAKTQNDLTITSSNMSNWPNDQFSMQQHPVIHPSRQHQQSASTDGSNFSAIPELNLMPGLNFIDTSNSVYPGTNIADQYFSGLDWIFDDLTEANSEPVVLLEDQWDPQSVKDESRPATYDNDDIFGGADTTRDSTETLNLLNLANAALFVPNAGQSRGYIGQSRTPTRYPQRQYDGQMDGQQQTQKDDEDSWPQEFRPLRKKPPTVELSTFTLAVELIDDDKSDNRVDDVILLDDYEEDKMISKWHVNSDTRLNLLNYLTHSCRHPWSIYSFSSNPPATFLCTSQLEKLVSLFFTKFHPRVPILHAPTFDPATVPPILLLSVVTIGLVFYPSEVSGRSMSSTCLLQLRKCTATLSVAFSELVRIGVMSAYEADQRGFTDVSINQAWILQQMFGVGSGDKRLFKIAERNRGGMVTAVRRLGLLYQTKETSTTPIDNLKEEETVNESTSVNILNIWRGWIAREARLRLGWFVYLHDQLFSCYLDIAPMFRHTEIAASLPCHADIWNAEDAHTWLQRYRRNRGASHPKSLLPPLRQLLRPSTPSPSLQLNQLEAYILSVTLYSIRWDSCKQRILFDRDSSEIDIAAEKAMKRLSKLANIPAWKQIINDNTPLAIEVQLLHLLANLHFIGPPEFFDKLRDAAGRSGMTSTRRYEAIKWLQSWMTSTRFNQSSMKKMLLSCAQLFNLVQHSINNPTGPYGAKSFISAIAIFHAALCMWAFIQFSSQGQRQSNDLYYDAQEKTQLMRLSPFLITAIREKGVLNLTRKKYSHGNQSRMDIDEGDWNEDLTENGIEGNHDDLVQAWIDGRYTSTLNDQVYDWPLSPLAVEVEGIGPLNKQVRGGNTDGNSTDSRASFILERFAKLLSRLNWGLAASFRLILLHMARHASQ